MTADSEDEDDIERTPMSIEKGASSVKKVSLNPLDSDSDLTPESESESEDEVRSRRKPIGNDSAMASGSSSSSSPGPTGPKMLGKNAKTDVLAKYWGAPEGDRRARRKSASKGPVSLLGVRKSQDPKKSVGAKRRQAGDSDSDKALPKRAFKKIMAPTSDQEDDDNLSIKSPDVAMQNHRKTSSMGDLSAIMGQRPPGVGAAPIVRSSNDCPTPERRSGSMPKTSQGSSISKTSSGSASHVSPSAAAIPGLATSGTERTSESNLALFWSAGVDGGRTRRRAQRESQITTPQTSFRRTRLSSESSRSRTPEVKRPRGRPPKQRGDAEPMSTSTKQENGQRYIGAKAEENAMCMEEDEDEDESEEESEDEKTPSVAIRPYMFPSLAARAAQAREPGDTDAAPGSLLSSAPLLRQPPFIRPDLASSAARSNSPLAGPPPQGVRAGTPGQPIRRNLRWGSGKTSLSRPMGSVSPLGRPLLGPNGSPLQPPAQPLDGARQLQFSPGGPDASPPKPSTTNGTHTSASASPAVQAATASLHVPAPINTSAEDDATTHGLIEEQVVSKVPTVKEEVRVQELNQADKVVDVKMEEATSLPQAATFPDVDVEAKQPSPQVEQVTLLRAELGIPALSTLPPRLDANVSPEMSTVSSVTSSSSGKSDAALQRRVSGRARKPPEMAAGQIQYKGSLIKLAAQRAKGAKKAPGDNSPALDSTSSPPLRTPPSKGRKSAPSTSPLKHDCVESTSLQHRRVSDEIMPEAPSVNDVESDAAYWHGPSDPAKMPAAPIATAETKQHLEPSQPVLMASTAPTTQTGHNGTFTHEDTA